MRGWRVERGVADKTGGRAAMTLLGTAVTDENGIAAIEVPARYATGQRRTIEARFEGERDFLGSTATASAYRG